MACIGSWYRFLASKLPMMSTTIKLSGVTKFMWITPIIASIVIGSMQLSQTHALFGIQQYDDGAYIAGTLQLLAGKIPYKDFVFVQPSGTLLLLTPIGVLSHLTSLRFAVAISRCLTVFAVIADVTLACLIVKHRGLAVTILTGTILAIYPATFSADRAFLIEPWLDLFILLGIKILFSKNGFASDKKIFIAGLLIGVAGTLKAMAVIIAFVCLLMLIGNIKQFIRCLLGLALGFLLPTLPFFILAPSQYIHDVIIAQLTRNSATTTPILARLSFMLGTRQNGIGPDSLVGMSSLARVVAIVIAIVFLLFLLLPIITKKTGKLDTFSLLAVLLVGASMMLPQIFYAHYGWYFIPFLAISLGLSMDNLGYFLIYLSKKIKFRILNRITVSILYLIIAVVAIRIAVGVSDYSDGVISKGGDPGPAIASVVPQGTCTLSDAAILLITADRYNSGNGCSDLVDATGTWLALDPQHPERSHGKISQQLIQDWELWFRQSQYVVLSNPTTFRIPWDTQLEEYFNHMFYLYKVKGAFIYKRR